MVNALHIVAFDVPAPPNYGGVIDIYYKVKALHELGCQIYLHCFQYGRPEATVLEPYCTAVWYYPRLTGIRGISLTLPYIVASRSNKKLLKRLAAIDAPVLFEGIHTTYYLNHPSLRNRFKAIRIHNIEHDYTRQLASKPAPLLKKIYFNLEQRLLYRYEHGLQQAQAFFALSNTDGAFFEHLYPNSRHTYLPPFHSAEQPLNLSGKGTYLLYHGNLSHPENVEAALFLLREV
ncbi:MAG: glycosyltransferase family 1 protein, partial [Chitinophagia bacterium]|nr:glycosyltransferase family 1 protein [Chitinophagia bacterium]